MRMIRLGIVDFDSSHAVEFTKRFNHVGVDSDQCVDGARVVSGCPGTSTMSPERIAPHSQQLQDYGVTLVDEPTDMIGQIDGVLVLSLCGDVHLERVRPFLTAGVPAYVDKPFTCSLSAAREIVRLADESGISVFSASAMRFAEEVLEFQRRTADYGPVVGAMSYGPAYRMTGNPGLFHYGIHPTELLFAVMGPGCGEVTSLLTETAEVVTGHWRDDRVGTLRGLLQGATRYGAIAFCERAVVPIHVSARYAYRNLCREIVRTFETGTAGLTADVMLETVAFIEATLSSETADGRVVSLN
ncbi:hypothetical protein Pan258_06110 [Symmachiella dynata]|uniref:Gfo/Idh/MocA family oxidoreductase n=1 Tax=Symmachiella dynata TaxID=2527995 RepID=UPI001189491F|nr:Gfo/Idh/MocA family oxidoreductase [Symmachiella dynata]QDT46592.1 hypothetical protein Pan258_06110 [Symmachiella dynata]